MEFPARDRTEADVAEALSGIVDYNSPTANMYGCEPCPKCKSKYRVVMEATKNQIDCDDCGFIEPVTNPEALR